MVVRGHHDQTSATLQQIITMLASPHIANTTTPMDTVANTSIQAVSAPPADTSEVTIPSNGSRISSSSSALRIVTSIQTKRCPVACNCQCHISSRYQTPRWISAIIGSLFYASHHTPALDVKPCNSKTCVRSEPSSSLSLTYYFPTWMMRSALVYSSWGNLSGRNSSWMVRMPREIPDYQLCWTLIKMGDKEGMKQLLLRKQLSPWDVDSEGYSVLSVSETNECFMVKSKCKYSQAVQHAVRFSQFEVCSLLLIAGSDWHLKDWLGMYVSSCPFSRMTVVETNV